MGSSKLTRLAWPRAMPGVPLTPRCWTRVEYDRLVELGAFEGDNIELIGGQLVVAEPQGEYHASSITAVDYAVRAALPPGWIVRIQAPVSLDDESAPEPIWSWSRGAPSTIGSRIRRAPCSSSRLRIRAWPT